MFVAIATAIFSHVNLILIFKSSPGISLVFVFNRFSRLISQFSAYYVIIDKYSYLLIYTCTCTLYIYLIFHSVKFDPQEKFIIINSYLKVHV